MTVLAAALPNNSGYRFRHLQGLPPKPYSGAPWAGRSSRYAISLRPAMAMTPVMASMTDCRLTAVRSPGK